MDRPGYLFEVLMFQQEELNRKLNEVEKWACCGEPESRVRAEHEVERLRSVLRTMADFKTGLRPTADWFISEAEKALSER